MGSPCAAAPGARRLRARPPCALALDLSDETRAAPLRVYFACGVARGKVSRRAVVRSTQTVGRRDRQTFIRLGPAPHKLGPAPHKFVSMCHFDCLPRIQVEEEIGAWCHGAA